MWVPILIFWIKSKKNRGKTSKCINLCFNMFIISNMLAVYPMYTSPKFKHVSVILLIHLSSSKEEINL